MTPEAFYYGIKFLTERYPLPLYITENGMSCHDMVSSDGRVHDPNRITFLNSYIGAMQKAYDEGANVAGYFLWTFLDNSSGRTDTSSGLALFMWILQARGGL